MRRPLLIAAAVLATAGLSGCAATSGSSTTTGTTGTTVVPAAQKWTATGTVVAPASAAPAMANTGTNWPTVIASLTAYGQWLQANPDPALVGTIAEPGCATANALTAEMQSLVGEDAHVTTAAPVFTSVSGLTTTGTNQAVVDIQVSRPAEPVVFRKTTKSSVVLSDRPQLPSTAVRATLILGTDKRWRFCELTAVLDDPDADASTILF